MKSVYPVLRQHLHNIPEASAILRDCCDDGVVEGDWRSGVHSESFASVCDGRTGWEMRDSGEGVG